YTPVQVIRISAAEFVLPEKSEFLTIYLAGEKKEYPVKVKLYDNYNNEYTESKLNAIKHYATLRCLTSSPLFIVRTEFSDDAELTCIIKPDTRKPEFHIKEPKVINLDIGVEVSIPGDKYLVRPKPLKVLITPTGTEQ